MALNSKTRVIGRNAALDAVLDTLNGGKLRIYDSTQPTDADTALGSQVLLADLALNATFGAAASSATKTANSITSATAAASGTASWFTLTTSAAVRVMDGSVGTSGANLNLNSVAISSGATVSVTALTVTMAA